MIISTGTLISLLRNGFHCYLSMPFVICASALFENVFFCQLFNLGQVTVFKVIHQKEPVVQSKMFDNAPLLLSCLILLLCHVSFCGLLVCQGSPNKVPHARWLNQQKCVVSQRLCSMPLAKLPVFTDNRWHSLASRSLTAISAFMFTCCSPYAHVCVQIFPTLRTPVKLDQLLPPV